MVVSDRRLTDIKTGKLFSSNENKQVLYRNILCFGYAGLAILEGIPTDKWLQRALSSAPEGASVLEILDHLTGCAERAVARCPLPMGKRHIGFMAVGWARFPPGEQLWPIIVRMSNFHDVDGKVLSEAGPKFVRKNDRYSPPNGAYESWGAQLDAKQLTSLRRRMRRYHKSHHSLAPTVAVKIFIDTINTVATRNSTVGKDLLATILHKPSDELTDFAIMSGDRSIGAFDIIVGENMSIEEMTNSISKATEKSIQCLQFYADGRHKETIAPLIAGTSITGMEFESGPPPSQSVVQA